LVLSSLDAPMMQFGDNWPLYISQAHHGFTPPNFDHAFHGPESVTKGHLYSFVLLNNYRTNFSPSQSGEFLFRYSLTSHPGGIDVSAAREFGYGASLPLVHAAIDGPQAGHLRICEPWVEVDAPNLLLLALKRFGSWKLKGVTRTRRSGCPRSRSVRPAGPTWWRKISARRTCASRLSRSM